METIFSRIRQNGKYSDACGPYKIKNIRDLTTGTSLHALPSCLSAIVLVR
jgi:hypothetical protein